MKRIPWRNKRPEEASEREQRMLPRARGPRGLFDSLLPRLGGSLEFPVVEVRESGDEILVDVEVPGIDPRALDIQLCGGTLTLSGERREESERRERGVWISERRYGSFSRRIPLPAAVDPDQVSAEQKEGVLHIHLVKQRSEPPKRIPVQATDRT